MPHDAGLHGGLDVQRGRSDGGRLHGGDDLQRRGRQRGRNERGRRQWRLDVRHRRLLGGHDLQRRRHEYRRDGRRSLHRRRGHPTTGGYPTTGGGGYPTSGGGGYPTTGGGGLPTTSGGGIPTTGGVVDPTGGGTGSGGGGSNGGGSGGSGGITAGETSAGDPGPGGASAGGTGSGMNDHPPIGTPPELDKQIAYPYGPYFIYFTGLGTSEVSPSDPYWKWYWYTYLGWVEPKDSNNHPHPPVGTYPSFDLPVPVPRGSDFVYGSSGSPYQPSGWAGVHVRPTDSDFAYWVWYYGSPPPGGGTGGPPPPPDGPLIGSWSFHWDMPSLKNGIKVSGTNVRIAPKLLVDWAGGPGDAADFPRVVVSSFRLTFVDGGKYTSVDLPVNKSIDAPTQGGSINYEVTGASLRLASTHFPDGGILMSATASVVAYTGTGYPLPFPCFTLDTPVAYNRGLVLSTEVVAQRQNGITTWHIFDPNVDGDPGDPDGPGYRSNGPTAWRTADAALTGFPGVNHKLVQTNHRLTKPALLSGLKAATAFFGMTHGSGSVITAYAGPGTQGLDDPVRLVASASVPNEIAAAVARPASVPGMNLVILHACETLPDIANSPGALSNAYRAFFGPQIAPDTAYLGFAYTVATTLEDYSPSDDYGKYRCLDRHAIDVYQRLAEGYTVQEAARHANGLFPPVRVDENGQVRVQGMGWSGDLHTRLMSVYTGAATPSWNPNEPLLLPTAPSAWYKVLNP